MTDHLSITGGVLTVEACSTLRLGEGVLITVRDGGALHLAGRADCPVTLTSAKAAPAPGDWAYIEIYDTASGPANVFEHAVIEHGGGGGYGAVWLGGDAILTMHHTTVRASAMYGVQVSDGAHLPGFADNVLTDNARGPVQIAASGAGDLLPGTYGPNDVEGIEVLPGLVESDQTWRSLGVPWRLVSGFNVAGGDGSARLTVEAGATLALGPGAIVSIGANGGLTLAGTAEAPVTVRSGKPVPAAGDWAYIEVNEGSVDAFNDFDHAVIEHGGGGRYGAVWVGGGASLAMTGSTVRDSGHVGVQVVPGGALRDFEGNTVSGNARYGVEIGADEADQLGPGTYGPNGLEGIHLGSRNIEHEAVWPSHGAPWVATRGLSISSEAGVARLTVQAGGTLALGPGAILDVGANGGLTLAGTAEAPVTVGSAAPVPAAGDWAYIELNEPSVAAFNDFDHVVIQHGGGAGFGAVWVGGGASLAMTGCTVRDSDHLGVQVVPGGELRDFEGNTLTANSRHGIEIGADEADQLGRGTCGPNGLEGILLSSGHVEHEAVWPSLGTPWIAAQGLSISSEAAVGRLTVEAGNTVALGDGALVSVGGNGGLTLLGTAEAHVTVTSAKPVPAPGDWGQIEF